jgi:hypothetical protein
MSSTIITRSGDLDVVDVTLVTDTSAYADNDVLVVPQKVPGAFRFPGDVRRLYSVNLHDQADQAQDIDLIFMDSDGALGTINAAVTMSDADAQKVLGKVSILQADYTDLINGQIATKSAIDLIMKTAAGSADLWIGAVLRSGTPTYAADSLRLKLGFA